MIRGRKLPSCLHEQGRVKSISRNEATNDHLTRGYEKDDPQNCQVPEAADIELCDPVAQPAQAFQSFPLPGQEQTRKGRDKPADEE